MPLSPSGRARARRWDKALDADRAAHRPDHNRDRAHDQLAPSHADPGSRGLPGTHGAQVADRQPNQHTTAPPAPGGDGAGGAP
jgi:hypothetical protein